MKKTILYVALGCSLLFTTIACNQHRSAADTALAQESTNASPSTMANIEGKQVVDRKIIKEGDIQFETQNAQETRKQITSTLMNLQGYVAQDNTETYGERITYTLTLRVPAENFEKLLTNITTTASKVENQNIRALDVTEDFIDIESRLTTKKELENRYKALLAKANTVEDILAIEREITSLRADIESFEGRLNYLKKSIAYSTLTVVFYEKVAMSKTAFGSEFTTAFAEGWNNLVSFTLGLFYIWPFILIILGVLFVVRRRLKRRKQKNN